MSPLESIQILAEASLRAARNDEEELATYEAISVVAAALGLPECGAVAIDVADAMRLKDSKQLVFADVFFGGKTE